MHLQASYLDSILDSSFSWMPAERVMHSCWKERAELFNIYIDVMRSTGKRRLSQLLVDWRRWIFCNNYKDTRACVSKTWAIETHHVSVRKTREWNCVECVQFKHYSDSSASCKTFTACRYGSFSHNLPPV